MTSMENVNIEAIEKIEMKLKKRIDIKRICDVVNKDHGLDRGDIANVVAKTYLESMLKQKFYDKDENPIK